MKHSLKTQVLQTLHEFPATRNSDVELTIQVWRTFHKQKIKVGATGEEGVWLRDVRDLPREDFIGRIRRKAQEEGKYLPTSWEVAKQRKINEQVWREAMGHTQSTFQRL